jgi:predicted outer membrane protein
MKLHTSVAMFVSRSISYSTTWQAKNQAQPAADAPQLDDGAIAYLYLQANLFEVEVAELGKSAGASEEVRKLGQMVANDHRGVIKSFEELLHMHHIKPVPTPASAAAIAQHLAVIADLKARAGADFDKAYLLFETRNHRAVIKALRTTLLPAATNQAVVEHFTTRLVHAIGGGGCTAALSARERRPLRPSGIKRRDQVAQLAVIGDLD